MSPFGPPWKLGVTGAVAVTAGIALLLVDWTVAQLGVFVAMLLIARGALHLTTTSFEGVRGALGTLQGGAEVAAGVLLLAWPHPTLLVVAVVVGTLVVVQGTVDLTITVETRHEQRHWKVRFTADAVQVALGIVLIARPTDTAHAASLALGALAILAGGMEIVSAFSERNAVPRAVAVV